MLSDRRQQILRALIEEYVSHAIPVGSKTLTEQYHLGVSSATVRNELSALEEAGYIIQPHTSAGRIPTDAGYREFVDDLLASDVLGQAADEDLVRQMRKSADALDKLIQQTSAELSRLTECLSIVTTPAFAECQIRQISLISLSNRQALAVTVMQDGRVLNSNLTFDEDVTTDDLQKIEQAIAIVFQGHSAKEVDHQPTLAKLDDRLRKHASLVIDAIFQGTSDLSSATASRLGMSSLMRKPEFHESSSLLPLMEILEDDRVIFKVFDDALSNTGELSIKIGQENTDSKLVGVSVIAGVYGRGESQGIVAVIGPKRMHYGSVIKAVKAAQNVLTEI